MIKKQTLFILLGAAAAVILLCVYLFVLQPILADRNAAVDKTPELLEGEELGMNNSILLFPQVERKDMQKISVHNSFGDYAFVYNASVDDFYLDGNEGAPYGKEEFSSLVVATGYAKASQRLFDHCDNMSEYGLGEKDQPSFYTLETRDGKKYTVCLGRTVPDGSGCYARLEGRDALYILDADTSTTLLAPIEDSITAILAMPASQSDYHTVKDFLISRDGEKFVEITTSTKKTADENGKDYEEYLSYDMKYPTGYTVSVSAYDLILQTFLDFYGESVCELLDPIGEKGFTPEMLSLLDKYGLKTPKYELYYVYNGLENSIMFSEKQEGGFYYAYSLLFNTICTVPAEKVYFLEYDLIEYLDKPLVQININDLARVTIDSPATKADFAVNGTGSAIVVTEASGRPISVPDFRQFYMTLLTLQMVTYADETDPKSLENIGTITLETDAGEKTTFGFYPYATRRCLYTVNGVGEFYCLRTTVDNIIAAAQDLLDGKPVVYAS